MFMFAGASSYLMPAGSAPTVAPRVSAPQMDANTGMTDPRFPRAGKGVLKDGSTAALPFAITPEHLLTGPTSDYAGNAGFDPLGLGSAYNMKWMREAELKHGRICMLAFYGYLTVDFGNTWPGAPKVSSLLAHDAAVKNGSMLFLLGVIGIVESLGYVAIYEMLSGESDRAPGDYGFDPLNYKKQKDYSEVELTHCRAAMLAFGGVITQSALFETGFPYVPLK
jgi:hypothetical protein